MDNKKLLAEYYERERIQKQHRDAYRENLVKAFDALTLTKNDPRLIDEDMKVETMAEIIEAVKLAIEAKMALGSWSPLTIPPA